MVKGELSESAIYQNICQDPVVLNLSFLTICLPLKIDSNPKHNQCKLEFFLYVFLKGRYNAMIIFGMALNFNKKDHDFFQGPSYPTCYRAGT
jgi:hypothetical protein